MAQEPAPPRHPAPPAAPLAPASPLVNRDGPPPLALLAPPPLLLLPPPPTVEGPSLLDLSEHSTVSMEHPNIVPPVDHVLCPEGFIVDWDALEIEPRWEEEGPQEVPSQDEMYDKLGLRAEDEREARERDEAFSGIPFVDVGNEGVDVVAALPCDDELPDERVLICDRRNPLMKIGCLYKDMSEFRIAMRQFAINNEFELGIESSSPIRYRGYCKGGDCPWRIHARPEVQGSPTIIVTAMIDHHTCTSSGRRRTSTPSSAWVASLAIPILSKKPHMGAKELQTLLQDMHNCTIGYDTVWKGKEKALAELYGTWENSFKDLFRWKEAVLEKMPDSVIEIDLRVEDGKLYFSRFFCAFGPCLQGFREGCRPYLSLDSTALNGRWNGHLPSACSVDGHNWMFPVAFGFFESETKDSWTWFMRQLHKAIGDPPLLAVCSDACKGLTSSVELVFPYAEKRECFRHLMQNYIKKFGGSEHMHPAAKAYRKEVFEHHIGNVISIPEVHKWLIDWHGLLWYRSGFNEDIKCDYITNNIAEVFNNWIKDYKDLPVCDLADQIRVMTMDLFFRRRKIAERLNGKILPSIINVFKARTRGLGHLSLVKGDHYSAEVRDINNVHSRHIVKAEMQYCSCLEWQHTGKPCQHALVVIIAQQFRDVKMEDFVHDYFSVQRFKQAYERRIEQLGDKSFWPKVEVSEEVGAPLGKRNVGRQRKNRIKGCLEGGSGKKNWKELGKAGETEKERKLVRGKYKCPNCGELGHRKNSPKCIYNGTKKRKRKPRKNTTKGWFPKEMGSNDVGSTSMA